MLDLKFIRQNPDLVRAGATKKHISCEIDRILELDAAHRELGVNVDQLRQRQKQAGGKIAQASEEERGQLVAEQKEHKAELKALEERQQGLTGELQELLLRVPMPPAADVPEGKDDEENTEVRRWGQPTSFEFQARSHQDLGEMHGWIDVERGARLAGSRNYLLKGDLVLLESAVMRFALDQMVERGFTPVTVPTLVRTEAMRGTGYFPGGEDQAYRCDERDDLWLVGTAEVPLTAMHAGEILDGAQLPLKFVAHSSCYRREAGTYGKDTRGLYRVHQFQKVEQVIIDVADASFDQRMFVNVTL